MSKSDGPKQDDLPLSLTLHVRDHCLCMHVRRAARATARRYDEALRPVGLTNGQFSLLMSLNRPYPGGMADVAMGEIASLLAMDRTTLTANLKPLERRGLVLVIVGPKDKRSRRLSLTEAGRDVLREALPIWRQAQVENGALVQTTDAESLLVALRALS
jgi:DNA-binding MarR family transcriptional regulator